MRGMQDILDPTLNELYHHGILGQKWGVRRFQNSDGSLTSAGRIRYGVNSLRSVASKASNTVNSLKGKSFNDLKIDALDYANRKGVLDFLDSKADAPFSAVRSSLNNTDQSSKAIDFISDYTSQACNSMDKVIGKINRYSTVVAAMRKNEPYVKVEDTSKPWMETFRSGKMGWNHTSDIENAVRSKAVDKYEDFLISGNYRGQSVSEAVQKAAEDRIRALVDLSRHRKLDWDNPMDIETVDGLKINSVIYNNGGGVQSRVPKAIAEQRAKNAKEVQDFIDETGRLPTVITNKPYYYPKDGYYLDMRHSDVPDFLEHHGIKGQKWGNRRYQNDDGSLTALGRVHYGVGAARENVGKAARALKSGASRTGNAIRKAVKPTDQELLEQYNKARAKQARKDLKEEIREMNGRKKRIRDMTDQEVIDHINRYRNEETLRALQRESSKSPMRKALDKAVTEAISRAAGVTLQNAAINVGKHLVDSLDTEEEKLKRAAQMARDREVIDKAKNGKSVSELLREKSQLAKDSRDAYEYELQERALRGDEAAKEILSNYKNAVKGGYTKPQNDKPDSDDGKAADDTPKKKKKKKNKEPAAKANVLAVWNPDDQR